MYVTAASSLLHAEYCDLISDPVSQARSWHWKIFFQNTLLIISFDKMACTKQTACKGTGGKPKLVTFGDEQDKKDCDDGKTKGKPGKLKPDLNLRPGLKKESKKRKGIPMKRSERSLLEV